MAARVNSAEQGLAARKIVIAGGEPAWGDKALGMTCWNARKYAGRRGELSGRLPGMLEWDEHAAQATINCEFFKFCQNTFLADCLMATGDMKIIEVAEWDVIGKGGASGKGAFSCGLSLEELAARYESFTGASRQPLYDGHNHTGRALEAVRAWLVAQQRAEPRPFARLSKYWMMAGEGGWNGPYEAWKMEAWEQSGLLHERSVRPAEHPRVEQWRRDAPARRGGA